MAMEEMPIRTPSSGLFQQPAVRAETPAQCPSAFNLVDSLTGYQRADVAPVATFWWGLPVATPYAKREPCGRATASAG